MYQINFFINDEFEINQDQFSDRVRSVLSHNRISRAELDLSIVSDAEIKELNEKYLKHQGPTDVLSFPTFNDWDEIQAELEMSEHAPHLGQIIISHETALKQSKRSGKSVEDQLLFYLEHALYHLMGFHHN